MQGVLEVMRGNYSLPARPPVPGCVRGERGRGPASTREWPPAGTSGRRPARTTLSRSGGWCRGARGCVRCRGAAGGGIPDVRVRAAGVSSLSAAALPSCNCRRWWRRAKVRGLRVGVCARACGLDGPCNALRRRVGGGVGSGGRGPRESRGLLERFRRGWAGAASVRAHGAGRVAFYNKTAVPRRYAIRVACVNVAGRGAFGTLDPVTTLGAVAPPRRRGFRRCLDRRAGGPTACPPPPRITPATFSAGATPRGADGALGLAHAWRSHHVGCRFAGGGRRSCFRLRG